MRRPIIAGNWKMNKTREETRKYMREFISLMQGTDTVDIVVAPPFTALSAAVEESKGSRVGIAAQDVHWEDKGAFTGEISPAMLKDAGVTFCIIGHSERRQHFGETDRTVNLKLAALLKWRIVPILCVGETLQERTVGKTYTVLEEQLRGATKGIVLKDDDEMVIAYEPVWAIGTGVAADPQQVQGAHSSIRTILGKIFVGERGKTLRIQYGGSLTPDNAPPILRQPDVEGALVGGSSLDPAAFSRIVKEACNIMERRTP